MGNAFLALFLFFGIGYSALTTNLNIFGDITVNEYLEPNAYNVLKKESRISNYVKEYSGLHNDSYDGLGNKKIYYWNATNDDAAAVIKEKWNVIFGGFCWQMLRTTDTGGVKMIYNGIPTNGQCMSTGTGQQIGTSRYNNSEQALSDVGYMYNIRNVSLKKEPERNAILTKTSMSGSASYYYGTGITYLSGVYTLTDATQDTWGNTYASSSGLYTCASRTATSCDSVHYIVAGEGSYMYSIKISDGNLLNYYNNNIVLGTNYTENNGIYTLTNTTTVSRADWYSNNATYKSYYICDNETTTCSDMRFIVSTSGNDYASVSTLNNYIYAKSFTYDETTNTYTLDSNNRVQFWNTGNSSNRSSIKNNHYTCLSTTDTCNTLKYVHFLGSTIYYVELVNGQDVNNTIDDMLYVDNVNATNSLIKDYIDTWYASNLASYTDKLEDTVFCNERGIRQLNGWNPNGGDSSTYLSFLNETSTNSLSCERETDRFSTSNDKARLTYPIGLPTLTEISLVGNNSLRKTGSIYWLLSPKRYHYYYAYVQIISSNGGHDYTPTNYSAGVRPVISLKPGTIFSSGNGSTTTPYIVDMN